MGRKAGRMRDETRATGMPVDALLLSGRVLLGLIYVISGISKLMNLDGFAASLEKSGVPMSGFMAMLGALVEALGGLAVVIGFQTRYAAVLMVLFTVAATLIAHRFWEFTGPPRQMQQTHFMKNLSIIGGFLLLAACGAGRYSFDGLWRGRSRSTTDNV